MAERSLRGTRLGANSFQTEEGVDFAGRVTAQYRTLDGEVFTIPFAEDAEVPATWDSTRTGKTGTLVNREGLSVDESSTTEKPVRTHWDMLLERRSVDELEELLQERLELLRQQRGRDRLSA